MSLSSTVDCLTCDRGLAFVKDLLIEAADYMIDYDSN